MRRTAIALSLILVCAATSAVADPVADFYKGKQLKFIIRSNVGGTYDLYGRLLSRHMSRHIPGNPTILPVNMGGGGGIKAANYVAETPVKTLDEAMRREIVIGTTGAGSVAVQLGAVMVNVIGAKFKLIVGYGDAHDVNLAMERGEVEGRSSSPWPSYLAATPHYVLDKLIVPLVQVGLEKEPELPNIPLLRDLAKSAQEKQVLDFMSLAVAIGRPVATTPGVPAERVAALRMAFDLTLSDPAFIAEANKQRLEIRAMTGGALADLVRTVIETPADVREKVKLAIQPKNAVTVPGARPAE